MRFWIGARGSDMKGEARGIAAATAGDADSPLASGSLALVGDAVTAPSPTWLAAHPRHEVVYAALEKQGRVGAFRRTGEATLTPLGETVATGDATCHVSVAPDGSHLIATSWGEGIVTHIALAADGRLGTGVQGDPSEDPYASGAKPAPDAAALVAEDGGIADLRSLIDRGADASQLAAMLAGSTPSPAIGADAGLDEIMAILGQSQNPYDDPAVRDILRGSAPREGQNPLAGAIDLSGKAPEVPAERVPRAHCSVFLPGGLVATTDLGYDLVRFWRTGPRGIRLDHEVALPIGTGPRHLSLHPSGHLHAVTEFSCEVYVLRAGPDGRWVLRSGIAASRGALPGDTAAELTRSRDGEFLYAGLRGSDTIAVLRVRGEGDRLEPVALAESGIRTPRHHVVIRDALLVAGQGSHEIASLALDQRTGIPGRVRHRLSTPSPQHILPVR
ncbi:lactonase family protein [Microbacterium stercoris]|uniref:Beta-propeller fold lactonase family protein n=1 Tax=Microbacterium stercoris TaxID=2820289 RepID=A0A939QLY8_9MICO|nr:beta-propeller fold lactonase family protein [Microbacterium stercoris]MBO3665109.1 beta-propeller fold lactonase family protein [Microbacterium stercoris]